MNIFDIGPKLVYSKEEIRARVAELAAQIEVDYAGRAPVFVGILTGSFIFIADLCRAINLPCEVDFMRVESYGSQTVTSGAARITQGTKLPLAGKPVIVVDEIVDTGLTLKAIVDELSANGVTDIRVCALIDKKASRRTEVAVDYVGFELNDGFLVGYGLDAAEHRRNLPDIWLLDE